MFTLYNRGRWGVIVFPLLRKGVEAYTMKSIEIMMLAEMIRKFMYS